MGLTIRADKMMKFLKSNGYKLDRIDGSHHIMVNGSHSVPVPKHSGTELDIKMISKILDETKIPKKKLLQWLGR